MFDLDNPFIVLTKETLVEQISTANSVAERIINADNQNKLIHEVRETSDIPEIADFRDWKSKAEAAILKREQQIDALIVERGLVSTATVDVPTETENYKAIASNVKAMQNTLKQLLGDEDKIKALELPDLKSIPGTRKASSGGTSTGTGTRRPRLSKITVDYGDGNIVDVFETKTVDGQERNSATLTLLSKTLTDKFKTKVDVKDLQSDLFAAANTDDLSTLEGKPVTFPVTIKGEGDVSTIVNVTATPTVK